MSLAIAVASMSACRAEKLGPPVSVRWLDPVDRWVHQGRALPCYSSARPPRFRVDDAGVDRVEVALEGQRGVEVERGPDGAFVAAPGSPAPSPGRWTVKVRAPGHAPASVDLCWVLSDEQLLARYDLPEGSPWASWTSHPEPRVRLRALVKESRAAFARSDLDGTRRLSIEAAEVARGLGFVEQASRRLFSAAFVDHQHLRYREALELLERAERDDARYDNVRGLARNAYLRGSIAKARSEFVRAKQELRRARALAREVGADRILTPAQAYLALVLAELGHFDEALRTLEQARPDADADADVRSNYSSNRASCLFQAHVSGLADVDLAEVEGLYRQAIVEGGDRISEQEQANLRTRLAAVALERGLPERASAIMAEVPIGHVDKLGIVRWLAPLVAARARLETGALAEAEAMVRSVAAQLDAAPDGEVGPAALVDGLLGQIELARGRPRSAARLLGRALAAVRRMSLSRVEPRSRSAFFYRSRPLRIFLVEALLADGRPEEAWRVAEGARGLLLEQLAMQLRIDEDPSTWREYVDARARARRQAKRCRLMRAEKVGACRAGAARARANAERLFDTLLERNARRLRVDLEQAPSRWLRANERILSVFRTPKDWVTFFVARDRVRFSRGSDPVGPWMDSILEAGHVFVVPGESRRAFDLPTFQTPRGPVASLVSTSILSASAVLARRSEERPGASRLLFVADTDGTLPRSRASALATSETSSATFVAGTEARHANVLELLGQAHHFHFEGHVVDGARPWDANLRLADGVIEVYDVISSSHGLRSVVLSGCTSGAQAKRLSTGLPEAFSLSGASVLATTRDLGDGEARRLLEDLYAFGFVEDPRAGWRAAVEAAVARGDGVWEAFRLFGGL